MTDTPTSTRTSAVRLLPDVVPAAPPRLAASAGVALLTAAALIAVLVDHDPRHSLLQGVDDSWDRAMTGTRGDLSAVVAVILQGGFGGPSGMLAPLGLVICLLVLRRWYSALYGATAYAVANLLLVLPVKNAVERPRPADPWILVSGGSFPSGHACGTAAMAVVLGALVFRRAARRRWWLFGALFTVTMMWSGTWVHTNWLSDVLAGALGGAGAALLLWRAFWPLLRREAETAEAQLV